MSNGPFSIDNGHEPRSSSRVLAGFAAVRRYLTKLRWYEDRLCSLSSFWLVLLSLGCVAGLSLLAFWMAPLLDDLSLLAVEGDFRVLLTLLDIVLINSSALWLLSFCLAALTRRVVLCCRGF
jgi:hypothetical protein